MKDLFLHEELTLLALRDRAGTFVSGTQYPYAVGGAVLAELLMARRIGRTVHRGKRRIEVIDSAPTGDPLLDQWIEKMSASRKPRSMKEWVGKIGEIGRLKHRVAVQLCRRGILRNEEDKVLGIFSRQTYPEVNPEPERRLLDRLEAAIFSDGDVDPRTAVLVALANAGGILRVVFDKRRLKERKERIAAISEGQMTAEAAKEAIEAMQAAVMVAVILPTFIATTTT